MKAKTVLAWLIFSCCQPTTPTNNHSSEEEREILPLDHSLALGFINDYVSYINQPKAEFKTVEWVYKQSSVTDAFKKELKRIVNEAQAVDPEYGLGFDPIINAQDCPDKGFDLGEVDSISGYLTVFGRDRKTFKLRMKLALKNDQWLVDGSGIINIPENKRLQNQQYSLPHLP